MVCERMNIAANIVEHSALKEERRRLPYTHEVAKCPMKEQHLN